MLNGLKSVLVLTVALSLVACGGGDPPFVPPDPQLEAAFLDAPNEITLSFSVAPEALAAADVQVQLGGQKIAVESVVLGSPTKIKLASPITDVAKALKVAIPKIDSTTVFMRDVLNGSNFVYEGNDLGANYTATATTFKVWSPVTSFVKVLLYNTAADTMPSQILELQKGDKGVWSAKVDGDLHGKYYRLQLNSYGIDRFTPDPYSKAATHYIETQPYDQAKSMVVDLARTNPVGWDAVIQPKLAKRTDAIVYEVHVRDFTAKNTSGATNRGKYLGVIEPGLKVAGTDLPVGLDHLKKLGVNAIQFLPIYDFGNAGPDAYNWGYDPFLYNVPEGQYSSNPADPTQTIRDVKTMVKGLQEAGLSVIMDVVYNHTKSTGEKSAFTQTVPFYYYRTNDSGKYLNETGVGNVLATERPMVRRFILDSLKYWATEYKMQGFRFDLMGTFDPDTVKAISSELTTLKPGIIMYGEPWTGGGVTRFGKGAQKGINNGVFNDDFRNSIIGGVFSLNALGFSQGEAGFVDAVKTGLMGSLDSISEAANGAKPGFTKEPGESTNYATSHDNYGLWDRIDLGKNRAEPLPLKKRMQKITTALVLTSQGLTFLHGGEELARTKQAGRMIDLTKIPEFVHNSYNAGDEVNQFEWERLKDFGDVNDYYAGLIALRKAHPVFRLATADEVKARMKFLSLDTTKNLIGFTLNGAGLAGESAKTIAVVYNGSLRNSQTVTLPAGAWKVLVSEDTAGTSTLSTVSGMVTLAPLTTFVAYQD
jgi:pullulanase